MRKFSHRETELEEKEVRLEEKRKKHITFISYVTIGIIVVISLFSLGVYNKYQDAKELLDEGGIRLARAEDLEHKLKTNVPVQKSSDSKAIKKEANQSHSQKHEQLKEKVIQLFEDSSPLRSKERRESALQRYENIKHEVEKTKGDLNTADYNWLKVYLDLANSNLKYSR